MKKICVSGAYGFIGKAICEFLANSKISTIGLVRNLDLSKNLNCINYIPVGDIGVKTNLKSNLVGADCIIHCAGRAHVMNEKKYDSLKLHHLVNVLGTKQLAEQAVEAGVKRLVFLSSIKIHGENTYDDFSATNEHFHINKVFTHKDLTDPNDPYAISKLEAEKILYKISLRTGLEVVVIRLPLVYGYGVKGNLERLMKFIRSGIPLPLSLVKNQRSMIGIDNLVDLLFRCIDHPEASGKTFLASDGEDLSTPELIKLIASSMGRKANLFPFSISMLKFLGSIFGRREEINRLVGSLRIDDIYTKEKLNWAPPISVEEGIRRMVQGK